MKTMKNWFKDELNEYKSLLKNIPALLLAAFCLAVVMMNTLANKTPATGDPNNTNTSYTTGSSEGNRVIQQERQVIRAGLIGIQLIRITQVIGGIALREKLGCVVGKAQNVKPLLDGAGHIDLVAGICRKQKMLVERHRVLGVGILVVVLAEPEGENSADRLDGLAARLSCDRCAAAARVVRERAVKSLVEHSREKRGLAKARVTANDGAVHV